jgi:predicted kinase
MGTVKEQKKAYFFIGLPGVGKSTFTKLFKLDVSTTRVSSDDYIEQIAVDSGCTYNEAWSPAAAKAAEKYMKAKLAYAIEWGFDIVWDQTNLTIKGRAKKLASIPEYYEKIGIVFATPDPWEHSKRLASRPGKTIPDGVLTNMKLSYQPPSLDEGFDYIYELKN